MESSCISSQLVLSCSLFKFSAPFKGLMLFDTRTTIFEISTPSGKESGNFR